ncbi:hypothetical protein [Streptomyces sp. ALI-76-A]|nr:hypothetical protein [Streptomyces sp. ALI-76-A]MDL5206432.1 hypothetical protein [Streptomyces sp. ALI-76-A]
MSSADLIEAHQPVAGLRRRFTADWRPACPLTSLIGPGQGN